MNWEQIINEVSFTAIRSRGPGGQNVNKVSSAARLYWHPQASEGLSEEEKKRAQKFLDRYLNKEGFLVLRSDEFRDLERNKERCLEKLHELLKQAMFKPKVRKKTKPSFAEKKRRREKKEKRGEIKKNRRKVDY